MYILVGMTSKSMVLPEAVQAARSESGSAAFAILHMLAGLLPLPVHVFLSAIVKFPLDAFDQRQRTWLGDKVFICY